MFDKLLMISKFEESFVESQKQLEEVGLLRKNVNFDLISINCLFSMIDF